MYTSFHFLKEAHLDCVCGAELSSPGELCGDWLIADQRAAWHGVEFPRRVPSMSASRHVQAYTSPGLLLLSPASWSLRRCEVDLFRFLVTRLGHTSLRPLPLGAFLQGDITPSDVVVCFFEQDKRQCWASLL